MSPSFPVARRRPLTWLVLWLSACGTGQVSLPGGGNGLPPSSNQPPAIQVGPSSTSSSLQSGQATQLSVTAEDPDGDQLGYAWTQISPATPQGTFSSRTQRNPTWTAPVLTTDTAVVLQVTIVDGQGAVLTAMVTVQVTAASQNRPPAVSQISVTPPSASVVAGDPVTLAVTATDPDGDPLTITWTQTAPTLQGTFSTPTQASTTWRSPPVVSTLTFSFQVVVTDGVNPTVTRTVDVQVKAPTYAMDIQPIWDANCTSCHPTAAQLDLTAGNSYPQLVNVVQVSPGPCAGENRVDSTTPASSSLLGWVEGTSCGAQMPPSGPLTVAELTKIQSWVLGGAPNN
jgi:Bacterial Ig domain